MPETGVMRELVTDVADPRLADYARLTDMELRTHLESAQGLFIAEGTKVISRAVAAGYPVRSVLLAERRLGDLPGPCGSSQDCPGALPAERNRFGAGGRG